MKPDNWDLMNNKDEYAIHRTYPDGTDVIISVKSNNGVYEVWSSAESRTSGPNDHLDSKASSLDEAIILAHEEANGWDDDLE